MRVRIQSSPKDKRPCPLRKKPGHLAAACPNKPAFALQGEPSAAHESAQRSFEIRVAETEGDERRVRGRPIETFVDAQGFQFVRGGYIPQPRGAQLGDFCAAAHNKRPSQGSTRRYFPISFDLQCDEPTDTTIHSIHSGSVEGLSPDTDEADKGVSGVTGLKNTETKTSASQNPVAGGGKGGDAASEVTAAMEVTAAASSRRHSDPQAIPIGYWQYLLAIPIGNSIGNTYWQWCWQYLLAIPIGNTYWQ